METIVSALREAAYNLEDDKATYSWGQLHRCNVGVFLQALLHVSNDEMKALYVGAHASLIEGGFRPQGVRSWTDFVHILLNVDVQQLHGKALALRKQLESHQVDEHLVESLEYMGNVGARVTGGVLTENVALNPDVPNRLTHISFYRCKENAVKYFRGLAEVLVQGGDYRLTPNVDPL